MIHFNQKRILFLSAHFFGYEEAIVGRLRELGAEVDFFNERPSDTILSKGLIRMKSKWYQKKINRYYQQIWKQISQRQYDYFLLIKGESIPMFFLENFIATHPETRKIFYSYDAVSEYPRVAQLFPFFDENFTFEPTDAEHYQIRLRPLFFLDIYHTSEAAKKPEYDVVFIGTAHTDRYLVGEEVRYQCKIMNLKTYFYYYAPGKVGFLLKRIFDKKLKTFDFRKLSFQKLSHQQIAEIYKESFAVLDINKPFQKGLTMRTFEALASGKKLLTTNAEIKKYPFYDEVNIHVLNRDDLQIDEEFFKTPFRGISEEIRQKMSLDSWIHCLFVEHQDAYWARSFR